MDRAEIVGMLEIKRILIDKSQDTERLQRWIAFALEILLQAELDRRDAVTK